MALVTSSSSEESKLDLYLRLYALHSNKAMDYIEEMRTEFFETYPTVADMDSNKEHIKDMLLYGGNPEEIHVFLRHHLLIPVKERSPESVAKYNKIHRRNATLYGKLKAEMFPEHSKCKILREKKAIEKTKSEALKKAVILRKNDESLQNFNTNYESNDETNNESNNESNIESNNNKENINPSNNIKRFMDIETLSDDECGNSIADLCPPKKKQNVWGGSSRYVAVTTGVEMVDDFYTPAWATLLCLNFLLERMTNFYSQMKV